jgi:hypothetical protein
MTPAINALDELDLLQACEEAVSVLLIPDAMLDDRDHNQIGLLLDYLNQRRALALAALRQQIYPTVRAVK